MEVLKAAPKKLKNNLIVVRGKQSNVYVSDDVTAKVRKERKILVALKKRVQVKYPGKKVFIPPTVPAVLLRENERGKLIRMYPGDTLPRQDADTEDAMDE